MIESEKKIRVLHIVVQPVLVFDDGVEFLPGPQIKPVTVRLSELPSLSAEILATVQDMQSKSPTA